MKDAYKPSEAEWVAWLDGSLDHDRLKELEAWLAAHPEDRQELEELQALEADMHDFPMPAVSQTELALGRKSLIDAVRRLDEDQEKQHNVKPLPARRKSDRPGLGRLLWLPAAIAALVIGFLFGRSGIQIPAPNPQDPGSMRAWSVDGLEPASATRNLPRGRQVAVRDLAVEPGERVKIELAETSSYELSGALADGEIQNALGFVVRNDRDPARRQQAVELLDEHCLGSDVCQILVYALTQDPSPEVRRAAAVALKDEQEDPLVRRSFIKMLVEDPSPELRSLAQDVLATDKGRMELGR
jgi:hypothetical protein